MTWKKLKIGDTITFTTITREGKQKVTRKVVAEGMPVGVNFNGWKPYYLGYHRRLDKLLKVVRNEKEIYISKKFSK